MPSLLFWVLVLIVAGPFLLIVLRGAPYVPSRKRDVEAMFDQLYHIDPNEVFVDIGSGDGLVLKAAARRGAFRAIGFEINPFLVLAAKFLSRHHPAVSVRWADFWLSPLPERTSCLYIFGEKRTTLRAYRRAEAYMRETGNPIHLISYGFAVPGVEPTGSYGPYFLYCIHQPFTP